MLAERTHSRLREMELQGPDARNEIERTHSRLREHILDTTMELRGPDARGEIGDIYYRSLIVNQQIACGELSRDALEACIIVIECVL
jgi:hypothetical protein